MVKNTFGFLMLCVVFALSGGCVAGSLASNTGLAPPGEYWSNAPSQMAHVGEEVRFDFVLHDSLKRRVRSLGWADYCMTNVSGNHIETQADDDGRFQFTVKLDHVEPGSTVDVRTVAYRQRGKRDYVKVQGKWLKTDNPYDRPDKPMAHDVIRLTVYEAVVAMAIPRPEHDLDPETGVLRIRKAGGTGTAVYIDRPGRPGFAMTGPDDEGLYHVTYRCQASQLNRVGTTAVQFVVYDTSGTAHKAAAMLETP